MEDQMQGVKKAAIEKFQSTTTVAAYLQRINRRNSILVQFIQLIQQVWMKHFHVLSNIKKQLEDGCRDALLQEKLAVAVTD